MPRFEEKGHRLVGTRLAIDHMAAKLEAATAMGATDVVDSSATDAVAAVQALTGGLGNLFAALIVELLKLL